MAKRFFSALHLLCSQLQADHPPLPGLRNKNLLAARARIFEVEFHQFRDTVLAYLAPDDQKRYDAADIWDGVRLRVSEFLEALEKGHG